MERWGRMYAEERGRVGKDVENGRAKRENEKTV
jgi:hypothetical protein